MAQGGLLQQRYEQLRADALSGIDVEVFLRLGTALLARGGRQATPRIWRVRRQRASIREGDFRLVDLLLELGVMDQLSAGSAEPAESYMEVG